MEEQNTPETGESRIEEPVFEQIAQTTERMIDLSEMVKTRFSHALSMAAVKAYNGNRKGTLKQLGIKAKDLKGMPDHMDYRKAANLTPKNATPEALFNAGVSVVKFINGQMNPITLEVLGPQFEQLLDDNRTVKQMAVAIIAFDRLTRLEKAGITSKNIEVTTVEDTLALESIKAKATVEAFGLEDPSAFMRTVEVDSAAMIRTDFQNLRIKQQNGNYEPADGIYTHGCTVYTFGTLDKNGTEHRPHHLSVNVETIQDIDVNARNWHCGKKNGGCGTLVSNGQIKNAQCPRCGQPKHMMTGGSVDIRLPQIMSDGKLRTYGGHQIHMVSVRISGACASLILKAKAGQATAALAIRTLMNEGVKYRKTVKGQRMVWQYAQVHPCAFDIAHFGMTFGLALEDIESLPVEG